MSRVVWDTAVEECIGLLRDLIRIPSVNPPDADDGTAGRDARGAETAAARYCAEVLSAAGIEVELVEAAPGRGSCIGRLRAVGPDRLPPLVLLGHLDVVPVDAESWTRDPFGAELADGVVWGRGAVDMKQMVAMELSVMLALRRSEAELRRDVIFAAVADEEAGGIHGALHLVERRPELFASDAGPAAVALNEVGGYSLTLGGRRFYTIQVAEKGILWTRLRARGTPGHGSMPHDDNAALHLADAVLRIWHHGRERPARPIPLVRAFFDGLGLPDVCRLAVDEPPAASALLAERVADPVLRRSLEAMLRDTVSPNVLRAGSKVNVIAGRGSAELDVRTLPGTDQQELLAEIAAAAGEGVGAEAILAMPAVEWPADAEIVRLAADALRRADPEATPLPMMITPGTDAKALARIGIPTYGFAPLRLDPDTPFLSLFHGHDERVPVSAIAFGLPVLHEVVTRFAARDAG